MMKIRKKILPLFLTIGITCNVFMIDIKNVFAEDYGTSIYTATGSNQSEHQANNGKQNIITKTSDPDSEGWILTCKFTVSTSISESLNAEIYNSKGKQQNINKLKESLAGNYVGLNVYETKTNTKTAKLESLTKTRTKYTCKICPGKYVCKDEESSSKPPESGSDSPSAKPIKPNKVPPNSNVEIMSNTKTYDYIQPIVSNCKNWKCNKEMKTVTEYKLDKCPDDTKGEPGEETPTNEDKEWCANQMADAIDGEASLSKNNTITYKDSNDINTTKTDSNRYNTMFKDNGDNGNCTNSSSGNLKEREYKTTCKWSYNRNNKNKVCINVKNGKITYVKQKEECNEEERYVETPSGSTYWYYFIPLNANSADDFSIEINSKSKIAASLCQNIIDTNEHWITRITDSEGNRFDKNIRKSLAKEKVANGCYLKTNIKIPIVQKFYNEQSNHTFKGFNFYYKPIDVNNPFPNGIPTNSIWTQKDVDKLTGTSFTKENITYIANVTNANAIRNYKDEMITHGEYLYTRWDNMYLNGVSNFIEKSGFVKRYVDKNNIYKLGCGSANENETHSDGTKNYMYQGWCKSQ